MIKVTFDKEKWSKFKENLTARNFVKAMAIFFPAFFKFIYAVVWKSLYVVGIACAFMVVYLFYAMSKAPSETEWALIVFSFVYILSSAVALLFFKKISCSIAILMYDLMIFMSCFLSLLNVSRYLYL